MMRFSFKSWPLPIAMCGPRQMTEVEQEEDGTRYQEKPRTAYQPTVGTNGAMRRHEKHEYPHHEDANPGIDAPFAPEDVLGFRRRTVV